MKPIQFKVRKLEIGLVTVFLLGTCQMWVCQHEKVGGPWPPWPPRFRRLWYSLFGSRAFSKDKRCTLTLTYYVIDMDLANWVNPSFINARHMRTRVTVLSLCVRCLQAALNVCTIK